MDLISYEWKFDIVPCFYTQADSLGRSYYLIPDGYGNWMKTDPRIDTKNVEELNLQHNNNILKVIRLAKYWQKRPTMPTIGSYLLEVLVLNYFQSKGSTASDYPDVELPNLFSYISNQVLGGVSDPKGIKFDINDVTFEDRRKISDRAFFDASRASEARQFETSGDLESSINKWGDIFGNEFPEYE